MVTATIRYLSPPLHSNNSRNCRIRVRKTERIRTMDHKEHSVKDR